MKLAYTIGALVFAAAVGGLGMTTPAQAQPAPQGRYCDHTLPSFGTNDCHNSWERCVKLAQPLGGFCTVNHRIAYRQDRYGHDMMDRS
jgi:hypothetical protein